MRRWMVTGHIAMVMTFLLFMGDVWLGAVIFAGITVACFWFSHTFDRKNLERALMVTLKRLEDTSGTTSPTTSSSPELQPDTRDTTSEGLRSEHSE